MKKLFLALLFSMLTMSASAATNPTPGMSVHVKFACLEEGVTQRLFSAWRISEMASHVENIDTLCTRIPYGGTRAILQKVFKSGLDWEDDLMYLVSVKLGRDTQAFFTIIWEGALPQEVLRD